MKEDRDYKVKKMEGQKGPGRVLQMGTLTGLINSTRSVPIFLDQFIDYVYDEDYIRAKEQLQDFILALKKRLRWNELDVFVYYYEMGYTCTETAAFMLRSTGYVGKLLRQVKQKAKTLAKTFDF